MKTIYQYIINSISSQEKCLAVLIDPDKIELQQLPEAVKKLNTSGATHIFVGGSYVEEGKSHDVITEIKKYTILPVVIFPGDTTQISHEADAVLFLSLISGRNPDYLIGKQVKSVSQLRHMTIEIIPTGYILIENGKETAVQRITNTQPISRDDIQAIVDTAKAGELLGMKLIYLEAGSGAMHPISAEIIRRVKQDITIPLIVGGGIKNPEQLDLAYEAGADLVVIGTAFENDNTFFDALKRAYI